jgi:colanic acid/amylovoran biosynthesis glycosyltransferase
MKPANLLIYKNQLLPYSQTFVKAQAEAYQNFQAHYVGLRQVAGLSLPEERTNILHQGSFLGKVREWTTLKLGFEQSFIQRLSALNPALIHAHFGRDGAAALPLANRLQIPLIVTFHGFDATVQDHLADTSLYQKVYFQRRKALKGKASLFIAVSEFIKHQLLSQGFPPDKVVVHYIGIDTKCFTPEPGVEREPIVLFVGRLVEKKGCEYLIRAMGQIQTEMPQVKCVIIGDGELRSDLEQQAQLMLHNYQFLGKQPPEVVRDWMQRAQVFCMPSITAASGDAEGFGLVFLEAQSMGLPVVSFASGGIPEAIAHEETGFLTPERDSDRLARSIYTLLTQPELWHRFSQQGQQRVQANFNLRAQTQLLEQLYQERIHHPTCGNAKLLQTGNGLI